MGKEARLLIRAIGRYLQPMLVPFGQNLYVADGPTVSFFGFPYPTRMAVARLSTGNAWVWSPIRLTNELADAVETVGPVSYIVSPNKLHHLALDEWKNRWPSARLYAPPGLARKKKELHFDAELDEKPDSAWKADIDQTVFRGSFAMEEVVFFHRASRTAIFGDLIQRFPKATTTGWKGMLMRFDDLVGAAWQHTPRVAPELPLAQGRPRCAPKSARMEAYSASHCPRRVLGQRRDRYSRGITELDLIFQSTFQKTSRPMSGRLAESRCDQRNGLGR